MTTAIIVYVLIVTVPLVAAGAMAERLCRLWSWPVRVTWAVTALLIVLVAGRTVARQMETVSAPSVAVSINTQFASVPTVSPSPLASAVSGLMSLPRTASAHVARSVGAAHDRQLMLLWCLMSAAMMALLIAVYARVWHARQLWAVEHFAGEQVRVSPNAGPAVIGLIHPEIVVPRWALASRPEDGRLIMMHETEHRDARDPALLVAMWGLVALFPWHPGAWYCLARMRLAIELDCDARVVRRGASLRSYAQLLVDHARMRPAAPRHFWLGAASLLEPSSHLEQRLNAMVSPNESTLARQPITRTLRTMSYLAIVATITVAACESHAPTAADISGLDAASAERNARKASIIDARPVAFYVNGVRVSADSARALERGNISTITVATRQTGAQAEIRITTVGQPVNGGDSVRALHTMKMTFPVFASATVRAVGTPDSSQVHFTVVHKSREFAPAAITIDGVPSTAEAMNAINPRDIAAIDVLKGPAAVRESTDTLAKNGLIRITLKH
ncbi:MAG: M56 family metallopeptidase [Gemmatimonadaceae bacterium]